MEKEEDLIYAKNDINWERGFQAGLKAAEKEWDEARAENEARIKRGYYDQAAIGWRKARAAETQVRELRLALEKIASYPNGGLIVSNTISGDRFEMIHIAREALKVK